MKNIDKAIGIVEYLLRKKAKRLEQLERRVNPTENEKIIIGEETEMITNVKLLIEECKRDINKELGRLPPQATDLEEVILGAIMLETPTMSKVANILKPEHFYLEAHQVIYRAIVKLAGEKSPIDMRTVVHVLRHEGRLELVGGAYYIAELTSRVSSAANVEYHSRILIEYAMRRELIKMGHSVMDEAYDDNADALIILDEAEKRVNTMISWRK